ncbi:unnamed protein product, partial [Ectocarpus fasciculatus]
SGGHRERRRLQQSEEEEGKSRWRWRWRRRGETADGRRRKNKAAAAPVLAEMVTEWTPLTRIREEHAPMPAPETKCMQVFGGVHNYKTKMCEVYERLSHVCVQVHVDDQNGEISFAPVAEIGSGDSSSGYAESGGETSEQTEEEEEEEEAARYGCDPRSAWSPWGYAVVTVEGRTVLDVVPPTIAFSETLVTTRSDLDPFLHVEALTYEPGGGGAGGGGAEGAAGEGISPEASSGGGGGSGGGQFLTFGLSSWNSALVGSAFLVVGLLLLVQPVLALKAWWREGGSDDRGPGSRGGEGGVNGGRGGRGRKLRGQWRYGQLETDWDDGSEFSDGGAYEGEGEDDDDDDDGWGSEGDWQGETSSGVGMPPSPSEGDHFQGSSTPRLSRRFMQDSLRRRAADGGALGAGGGGGGGGGVTRGDAGGIQLGPMGKSGRAEAYLI